MGKFAPELERPFLHVNKECPSLGLQPVTDFRLILGPVGSPPAEVDNIGWPGPEKQTVMGSEPGSRYEKGLAARRIDGLLK